MVHEHQLSLKRYDLRLLSEVVVVSAGLECSDACWNFRGPLKQMTETHNLLFYSAMPEI